ncbi:MULTISPECIES: carboxymuconolactone decarboxylase family protein [unclassified Streptomyces]|uniref:carboxymuconolactone decarboxylase family protein n=1 Tax=unclassified Streptomyces TaxID=2593676 RepID=UPI000360A2EC|nr:MULTISPECIES: carboxymuconolactone decarboxylase family protein [unclassified Streptomyces]MYQ79882.1 alkylhydroperoxidase [Streptomyces sp. SID4923]
MTHIALDNDLPGITGLMANRPDTAAPLNHLAETLLRAPASLPQGERELIAAYVSHLNRTPFCAGSHSAFAAAQLVEGQALVDAVLADPATAPIGAKLRALLAVAAEVQAAARAISDEAVAEARRAGASDADLHDTVLIAASFCMFNRYVSCLDTALPESDDYYLKSAHRITTVGYGRAVSVSG